MTTATATESMLSRIRALLAKAESTDYAAEAEALTAKATDLMTKYGIDQTLLGTGSVADNEQGSTLVDCAGNYAIQRMLLINAIAIRTRCKVVRLGNTKAVNVYGAKRDRDLVEMLYTSLAIQSANAVQSAIVPAWEHGKSFRVSFLNSYATRIGQRLDEQSATATAEAAAVTPGAALVLADAMALANRTMLTDCGKVKAGTASRSTSHAGHAAGKVAANRANLGGQRAAVSA